MEKFRFAGYASRWSADERLNRNGKVWCVGADVSIGPGNAIAQSAYYLSLTHELTTHDCEYLSVNACCLPATEMSLNNSNHLKLPIELSERTIDSPQKRTEIPLKAISCFFIIQPINEPLKYLRRRIERKSVSLRLVSVGF